MLFSIFDYFPLKFSVTSVNADSSNVSEEFFKDLRFLSKLYSLALDALVRN